MVVLATSGASAQGPTVRAVGQDLTLNAHEIHFISSSGVSTNLTAIFDAVRADSPAIRAAIDAGVAVSTQEDAVLSTAMESRMSTMESTMTARISTLEASISTMMTDVGAAMAVQQRLVPLVNELAANASRPTIAECDPIANPVNGATVVGGDHGRMIPPGISVSFTCSPGFYLVGANRSTCRSDTSWSSEAPRCSRCPDTCTTCSGSDVCTSCTLPQVLLEDGTCVNRPMGSHPDKPGRSCLALWNSQPNLRVDGWFYLVDAATNTTGQFWCDMQSGYTLVGRGIGGQIDCWQSSRGDTCFNGYGRTFKFSDTTIAGFQTSTFKYQMNGTTNTRVDSGAIWYWRGGDSGCVYQHSGVSDNDCNTAYVDENLSEAHNPSPLPAGNHLGLGDWGNGWGCLHTNQRTNNNGWYVRGNGPQPGGCTLRNGAINYCTGANAGCDANLWVK